MDLMLAGPGTMIGDYDVLTSPNQHHNSFVCHTTIGQVGIMKREEFIKLQNLSPDGFTTLITEARVQ
jgi:hypothetical protein